MAHRLWFLVFWAGQVESVHDDAVLTFGDPGANLGPRQRAVTAVAPGRKRVVSGGRWDLQQVEPPARLMAAVWFVREVEGTVAPGPDRRRVHEACGGVVDGCDVVALPALDAKRDGIASSVRK